MSRSARKPKRARATLKDLRQAHAYARQFERERNHAVSRIDALIDATKHWRTAYESMERKVELLTQALEAEKQRRVLLRLKGLASRLLTWRLLRVASK